MSISRRPVILGGKWNETMEEQTMKYGVIDVGGGLRGIYGAGVLDRCLEEDLRFDLCIGVSQRQYGVLSGRPAWAEQALLR